MDTTSLTFILSIFITIFLSNGYVEDKIKRISDVVKVLLTHADMQKLENIVQNHEESGESISGPEIKELRNDLDERVSNLELALRCNVTILFWSTFFYLLLLLFSEFGFYEVTHNQIFLSVLTVTLLPYVYRLVWFIGRLAFDSRDKYFGEEIKNKNLLTRYPAVYSFGIISYQFLQLLIDASLTAIDAYDEDTSLFILSACAGVGLTVLFLLIVHYAVPINRAFTYNFFHRNRDDEDLRARFFYKGVRIERNSFILAFIVNALTSFYVTQLLISSNVDSTVGVPSGMELKGYSSTLLVVVMTVTVIRIIATFEKPSLLRFLRSSYRISDQ